MIEHDIGRAGAAPSRWAIRIGSGVECTDGRAGRISGVVVSPRTREVTHLIVTRGALLRRDVLAPVAAVASAEDDVVRLRLSAAELAAQPPYRPEAHVAPHPTWQPPARYARRDVRHALPGPLARLNRLLPAREGREAPREDASLDTGPLVVAGARVECRDGVVGQVALVLLDPEARHATHIVVHERGFLGRELIVPLDWATTIERGRITLDADREQLDRLPSYRPDAVIQSELVAALWEEPALRWLEHPVLRVAVADGVVTLRGHVADRDRRRRAEAVARRVPGVLAVRNELVADDDLTLAVAAALGRDPRTKGRRIAVDAFQGIVHLRGQVPSVDVVAAAEEVASGVPGARSIASALLAPDGVAAVPGPLLPPVGVPVYATDREVGRIAAVILSPRTRRATGLVLDGRYVPDDMAAPVIARRVVVPIELVVRCMASGIDLRLDADAVLQLPPYREEDYVVPDPAWEPPIDYARGDVRFALDAAGARRPELIAATSGGVAAAREHQTGGRDILPVRRGQRVVCRDGDLGVIDHVLIDPATQQVAHFVVRAGALLPKDTIVPLDWVAEVEDDRVIIDAGIAQLAALAGYRPADSDGAIANEIRERLRALPGVAAGPATVDVAVTDGVVTLSGTSPDKTTRGAMVRAAEGVPGVWEVRAEGLDLVDEAGLESFPASDPPAWTLRDPGPPAHERP